MENQSCVLILKSVANNTDVYRLKIGWKLRFTCESVLTTKNVRLFCDHLKSPDIQKLPVTQEHYEELKWQLNDLNFQGYELITEEIVIILLGFIISITVQLRAAAKMIALDQGIFLLILF
ncbi:hypothetical protein EB796_022878 [Bugula neritina]|uniref:Uncharacterized protein n=1 Tax=Bugula neritina TaxID=10212 RepID=A0A7J7IY36_BUGNE|nr:hypothetical protein EB796_022878 [Bugula neritina]